MPAKLYFSILSNLLMTKKKYLPIVYGLSCTEASACYHKTVGIYTYHESLQLVAMSPKPVAC